MQQPAVQREPVGSERGVGWRGAGHQGEENSGQPNDYECFQKAMIADWRQTFAAHGSPPDVPFVFVQLQPCGIPPAMRYAQAQALTANSGL